MTLKVVTADSQVVDLKRSCHDFGLLNVEAFFIPTITACAAHVEASSAVVYDAVPRRECGSSGASFYRAPCRIFRFAARLPAWVLYLYFSQNGRRSGDSRA